MPSRLLRLGWPHSKMSHLSWWSPLRSRAEATTVSERSVSCSGLAGGQGGHSHPQGGQRAWLWRWSRACVYSPWAGAPPSAQSLPSPGLPVCSGPNLGPTCPLTGFYCPEGSGLSGQPCPPGTYGPVPGLRSRAGCHACDAGRFCPSANATEPAGQCWEGFFCSRGSSRPNPEAGTEGTGTPAGHRARPRFLSPQWRGRGQSQALHPLTGQPLRPRRRLPQETWARVLGHSRSQALGRGGLDTMAQQ